MYLINRHTQNRDRQEIPGSWLLVSAVRLVAVGLLTVVADGSGCAARITLQKRWEVSLPWGTSGEVPRLTACQDGSIYVAGRAGVVALTRDGRLSYYGQSGRVERIACDQDGVIYGFTAGTLLIGARSISNGLIWRPAVKFGMSILNFAVADSRHLYLLAAARDVGLLHWVTADGLQRRSFGEIPDSGSRSLVGGHLLWDSRSGWLLYLPERMPEIQIYSKTGTALGVRGFGPFRPSASPVGPARLDRILGAALVSGGLVLQNLRSSVSDGSSYVVLEFLNQQFESVSGTTEDYGRLLGSNGRALLYFVVNGKLTCRAVSRPHGSEFEGPSAHSAAGESRARVSPMWRMVT